MTAHEDCDTARFTPWKVMRAVSVCGYAVGMLIFLWIQMPGLPAMLRSRARGPALIEYAQGAPFPTQPEAGDVMMWTMISTWSSSLFLRSALR